jgi:hypothetical protein
MAPNQSQLQQAQLQVHTHEPIRRHSVKRNVETVKLSKKMSTLPTMRPPMRSQSCMTVDELSRLTEQVNLRTSSSQRTGDEGGHPPIFRSHSAPATFDLNNNNPNSAQNHAHGSQSTNQKSSDKYVSHSIGSDRSSSSECKQTTRWTRSKI